LGDQLIRSGTSVGANYRAACRARSHREFLAKLGIVEEEADESIFWLDLMSECGVAPTEQVTPLRREGDELLSIIIASIRTARRARPAIPHSAFRTPHSSSPNPQSAIRNPQSSRVPRS
jgi:four helix bundle protein